MLRKRLSQERKLGLKRCIDLCRSSEATSFHLKNISGASNGTTHGLNRLNERLSTKQATWKQNYDQNAKNDSPKRN